MKLICVRDFSKFYKEHKGLMEEHTKGFSDTIEDDVSLDVDEAAFQDLLDSGVCNLFEIEVKGNFAGYISVVLSHSPLFNKVTATIDHFIITKEFRGTGLFKQVLEELSVCLKEASVDNLSLALPQGEAYDCLAKSAEFSKQSVIYNKNLGEM